MNADSVVDRPNAAQREATLSHSARPAKSDAQREQEAAIGACKDFCRRAGMSSGEPPQLAADLPRGASVLRFERDVAEAMIEGLCARFATSDIRRIASRINDWREAVTSAFAAVEGRTQPGAGRALWAQFARRFADALAPGESLRLGPVVCVTIDVRSPAPVTAPADTAVVSLRSGRVPIAVVETPVFREATLGQALQAAALKPISKLMRAYGLRGAPLLAARALRIMAREARRGGRRKRSARALFKIVHDEALRALDTPLFAGAPSAEEYVRGSGAKSAGGRNPGRRDAARAAAGASTHPVPVLMYHRIAPAGEPALDRFRTAPADFDGQLEILQELGCRSITSDSLLHAFQGGEPLPERSVLITFDDGYADFAEHAFPALNRRSFQAEVFLVTDLVGTTSSWDARFGAPPDLMDWPRIRELHGEGIRFGSHLATHAPATHLTSEQLLAEAARSRRAIEANVGSSPASVAMPYGLYDERVTSILDWSGFRIGFSTAHGWARPGQNLLRLPRVEVRGGLSPRQFRDILPWT